MTLSTLKVDIAKFFSSLESDAGKFCAAFVKLFGKAPAAIQVVENFVSEVAPVITAAVAFAAPSADGVVTAALATVETGLAGIQAAATAAASGTSLLASLENFSTTVPTLLSSLDVKDAALSASITKIVTLVVNEAKVIIPAVQSWVSQLATPAA
ncbi:MAG: hypothetical protein WA213_21030 [Terriglobales bacterium]